MNKGILGIALACIGVFAAILLGVLLYSTSNR